MLLSFWGLWETEVDRSVRGAAQEEFTFGRWHRGIERVIEGSGLAWTFLRPNSFMQNLVNYSGHAGAVRRRADLERFFRAGKLSGSAPDLQRLLGREGTRFEKFARDYAGALR